MVVDVHLEPIESAHQPSPGAPQCDRSDELGGLKEIRVGMLVDPKRASHVGAVRGHVAEVLEMSIGPIAEFARRTRRPFRFLL